MEGELTVDLLRPFRAFLGRVIVLAMDFAHRWYISPFQGLKVSVIMLESIMCIHCFALISPERA